MNELDNIGCITYCKAKKKKPPKGFHEYYAANA